MQLRIEILQDTYTTNEYPNHNYNDSEILRVADRTSDDIDKDKTWLKVDLSSLPNNATITSASLFIYSESSYNGDDAWVGDGRLNIRLYPVKTYWNVDNITKETEPDIWTSYNGKYLSEESFNNKWIEFNILSRIEGWVAGTKENHGFMLMAKENQGCEVFFHSHENTNKPYILIEYEVNPFVPVNLVPITDSVLNLQEIIRFSWNYIANYEGDIQKGFVLQYSSDKKNWETISKTTANNFYDMPIDTLNEGIVYWRIKVKNQYNKYSPYSSSIKIIATMKPSIPTITTSGIVHVYRPTITWECNSQYAYNIEVYKDDIKLWDSGKIITTLQNAEIGIDLENKQIYLVKVRILNKYGYIGEWGEKSINTSFQVPSKPNISLLRKYKGKGIVININNPNEGIRVIENQIFRKVQNEDKYICIAILKPNDSYIDYTVKSNVSYKYYVRAVGETQGYLNSNVLSASIDIRNTILTDTVTNEYVEIKYNVKKSNTYSIKKQQFDFSGREYPVIQTGINKSDKITITAKITDTKVLDKLKYLYKQGNYILFRDFDIKMYADIKNLQVVPSERPKRLSYKVTFNLIRVSYDEDVR